MSRIDAEVLLQEGKQAALRGEYGQAAQCWRNVLAMSSNPDLQTQAYFNLGLLFGKIDNAPARVCFQHALDADAENHEAREQLAVSLAENGEIAAAIEHMERLVQAQPAMQHHLFLGSLYCRQGERAAAESHYRAGLALMPEDAAGLSNLGLLLTERGMDSEALSCLKQALGHSELSTYADSGALRAARDSLDVAAHFLERAIARAPGEATHHCNLAVLQIEQRRLDEAEVGFRTALRLNPDDCSAAGFLGQLLLAQGRYAEGWRLHEARFAVAERTGRPLLPALPTPVWRGEPLPGKVLLLRQEQGYGDEIQFIRYLPRLRSLGPARILVQCRAALLPLLACLPNVELLTEADSVPPHDAWISTMSLPLYCDGGSVPAALPYLHAPPSRIEAWHARLGPAKGNLRVGLLWQGHRLHANDAHRSLASVEVLAPLWDVSGVEFISLQREPVSTGLPLCQFGDELADFADAAALIMQTDLVITVDSAYAHLAAALGKTVWVLVSSCRTDWRWGYAGERSAWYPGCMRLFRQASRGDWTAVIAALAVDLHEFRRTSNI